MRGMEWMERTERTERMEHSERIEHSERQGLIVVDAGDRSHDSHGHTIESAIGAWLDEKGKRTGSAKTRRAYRDAIAGFRAFLRRLGLDLDGRVEAVADAAQIWSSRRASGGDVAASTHNQRLAILSSFYAFAVRRRMVASVAANPIDLLDRRKVESYGGAVPLDREGVRARMGAIDRSELLGKRDYALLAIALVTGRRLSEIADLTWGDVSGEGDTRTLTFRRTKGDKQMRDDLPPTVSEALLDYLGAVQVAVFAGDRPTGTAIALAGEARDVRATPLWCSLSANGTMGRKLSVRGIAKVAARRIGTSKFHATRHTFAHTMEDAGATVSEIQRRLGHSDLKTTGRYLQAMRKAENRHAGRLAELLGL